MLFCTLHADSWVTWRNDWTVYEEITLRHHLTHAGNVSWMTNGCATVLGFHSYFNSRSFVQLQSNFHSALHFSMRRHINQKTTEEATMARAQKVWQYIQRMVTIVVRLASDLLSWHDKYLAVEMLDWNKTGGLWDTDGSFVSAWHEALTSPICPSWPPNSTYLPHLSRADGGVALVQSRSQK